MVDEVGHVNVVLGFIYIGVGGAVDDSADLMGVHKLRDGRLVGDVELGDIGIVIVVVGIGRGDESELAAELTVGAGDQYVMLV